MWSERLKDTTRNEAGPGAMVKSDKGESGMIVGMGAGGVKISAVESKPGSFMPTPTGEIVAEFADIETMIAAGWVID